MTHFALYQSKDGWRWRLVSANGKIVATGEAHTRKRDAKDLSKLLDYVYFDTLPMKGATPGNRIDFSILAEQATFQAHRHVHVTDQAKHFRLMELSDRLTKKFSAGLGNARALAAHRPIYDNAFAGAMAAMDGEDLIEGAIPFDARLA